MRSRRRVSGRDLRERDVGPIEVALRELFERRVDEGDLEAEALGEVDRDAPLEAAGQVVDVRTIPEPRRREGRDRP